MTLRIIATGGTFDKHYDELTGQLVFRDSVVPQVIRRARINPPYEFEALRLQDSLDMGDADRQRILASCAGSAQTRIVIVHGTDTMPETAAVLGRAGLPRTIILTGAMIPYEFTGSDALFNFGFACGVAQTLPHGVHIAMNGQIFSWDDVRKDRLAGVFQRC